MHKPGVILERVGSSIDSLYAHPRVRDSVMGVTAFSLVCAQGLFPSVGMNRRSMEDISDSTTTAPLRDLVHGPCAIPKEFYDTGKITLELAHACRAAYRGATVGLVNYSESTAAANDLARGLESDIARATDGVVNLEVETVQPSLEARAAFAQYPCVSRHDIHSTGASSAYATMPELRDKDYVVSISDKPTCKGESFYAFAYLGGGMIESVAADQDPQKQAEILDHEEGHALGLGHSSSFLYDSGLGFVGINNYFNYFSKSNRWSLPEYVTVARSPRNGEPCSIMGPSDCDRSNELNPIHKAMLDWPLVKVGEKQNPFVALTENDQMDITGGSTKIVVVNFKAPLQVFDDKKNVTQKFNSLMVVPAYRKNEALAPHLYLVNGTDTFEIGAAPWKNNQDKRIELGDGREIVFGVESDGFNVTLQSSQ